jgi:hypothetical protein
VPVAGETDAHSAPSVISSVHTPSACTLTNTLPPSAGNVADATERCISEVTCDDWNPSVQEFTNAATTSSGIKRKRE